ncbi:hypothetical protein [Fusobacterium sp.]|uniref:hypothetical protein n=1 Tax=Fusobacterium sp. TaxID=68766 RepID=UPI0029052915|nr:hypothetical protein [Fusobacterium sp.]MDU1912518.1 hypothetical protein [Fusobacterium sp.]
MDKKITKLSYTPQGEKLKLTEKQEEELLIVYSENEKGFLEFKEFYNPEITYSKNDFIIPIRSVYGGIAGIEENITFANIIGSTDDPKPFGYTVWLDLMQDALIEFLGDKTYVEFYLGNCVTDKKFYYKDSDTEIIDDSKHCKGVIVGGHIISGDTPSEIAQGSTVYLLPICNKHNGWYDRKGIVKKYMKATASQDNPIYAIILNNYFQKE